MTPRVARHQKLSAHGRHLQHAAIRARPAFKRLHPCLARTGVEERSCSYGERGFHSLPGSQDCLVSVRLQVGVALRGLEAFMAEEVLDLVERDSLLHQPRGAGVAHGVRWVVRDGLLLTVAVEVVGAFYSRPPGLPPPVAVIEESSGPALGDGGKYHRITV